MPGGLSERDVDGAERDFGDDLVDSLELRSGEEAAVWPRVNLAWLYLAAQRADRAEAMCREAMTNMTSTSAGTSTVVDFPLTVKVTGMGKV